MDEGQKEESHVPSAQPPSAVADQAGGADLPEAGSPTALDILVGSGAAAAAAEATQPNCRVSPGNSVATEILNSKDDEDESSSEEQEEESVQGTPTGVLSEQVVPLLPYLDHKVAKYGDPRHRGSYVKLVRNRTRTKVMTSPLLASLDKTVKDLKLKNEALRGHLALSQKLQKVVNKMRDEKLAEAEKEFAKKRKKLEAKLDSELAQNRILSEELCSEFRAQRAEAERQLVEVEGDHRRATDRTREELAERVNRCLKGYTHWEVAAQERITLRGLEIRAAELMSGDSRSRWRVAKRLDAFLSRSQDAIANLEAEVSAVLRQLGLRNRADD
ncbi:hypothetical protein AXG93_4863s1030 [Marchantia polymorpha subsp. ruderalis]|uniref:Uncharacterized protein n=1 Tax=Marchantia polymorpha subsp. ruderalis TaxID=1480154 RepID=A0A176VV11_MARPO|nr:hypothetical protein AXG93_4863s1030 [Marchantia polymorpha subsp. ruderalis]